MFPEDFSNFESDFFSNFNESGGLEYLNSLKDFKL